MKRMTRVAVALASSAAMVGAVLPSAVAMGSGNPYEDLQVGVTYTVYQPTYVGGLKLTHSGTGAECPAGTEQNLVATYGKAGKAAVTVTEGNPLCSDPQGAGQPVATIKIQGQNATVQAYCDPSIASQWKSCSTRDVGRFGGDIQVTLPAGKGLRPTKVVLVSYGKHPISYQSFIKMAKSLTPLAQMPTLVGGMATCSQNALANTIEAGLSKGTVLVSVDSFACKDGWAYAFATTGDGKGHDITQTFVFEAEGQFWIPKDRSKVCGTINVNAPATRPADAQVPASIWPQACNTN